MKPTNAVSATRNTLNESTKNCSSRTSSGPSAIDARGQRARRRAKVAKLKRDVDLRRAGAVADEREQRRRRRAECRGRARISITLTRLLQLLEVLDVEAVELLADLEEEHAEDQHADQHVERDAELDHHRHAVGRAGRGEEQAVLHRQEADHLRHRLAPRDHHQERQQHAGHRDAERARVTVLASCEIGSARLNANTTSTMPISIVVGMLISVSTSQLHVELADQPVQEPRQQHTLSASVSAADAVQVRLARSRRRRSPSRRASARPCAANRSIERQHAPLRQHREREQQQDRREAG